MGGHLRLFSFGDTFPNYIIQYTPGNIHCKEKNLKKYRGACHPSRWLCESRNSGINEWGGKNGVDLQIVVINRKMYTKCVKVKK